MPPARGRPAAGMSAARPSPREILAHAAHRPWPLPARPWVMRQTWSELLFAHWPVAPEAVARLLPAPLRLDTYEGHAWIGVVPFLMSGVRVRGLPPLPTASAFPELNVRTYVRAGAGDRPGVWFSSLDATSRLAVLGGRHGFGLPYVRAAMDVRVDEAASPGERVQYRSHRVHRGARPAELRARYGPVGPVESAQHGSLEEFLTERYVLYSIGRRGTLREAEVQHERWPLQRAAATFERNTMVTSAGLPAAAPPAGSAGPPPPLLHYAARLEVLVFAPRTVG